MNFQGIGTSIAKKPYIFVILQGGVRTPCLPSGSANDSDEICPQVYDGCNFNFPHVLAVDHDNK